MKKTYLKPDADYIKFYSDEEMTGYEEASIPEVDTGSGEGRDDWE